MDRDISFGSIVKEHRQSLDLTQAELARRVACATITIRKIEYDALRPSIQIAERLATSLKIPLEERADFVRLARTATLKTRITCVLSWRIADEVHIVPCDIRQQLTELGRHVVNCVSYRGFKINRVVRIGMQRVIFLLHFVGRHFLSRIAHQFLHRYGK